MYGSALLACVVLALLGLAIPGLLLAGTLGESSPNFWLMFAIVIWCTLRLVGTGLTGQRRLTLMCFYVFVYVFLGVQPLLSIWSHSFPHNLCPPDGLVTVAVVLVALGIGAFELGYYRLRPALPETVFPSTSNEPGTVRVESLSLSRLWLVIIVVSGLVVLVMWHYGPYLFLAVRGSIGGNFQVAEMTQSEWLLVVYSVRTLAAVPLFISLYLWKSRQSLSCSAGTIRRLKAALIYLTALNAVVSNPLNAPRLWSGSLLLAALFISLKWKGTRSFLTWAMVACAGLLLLFAGTDPRRVIARVYYQGGSIGLVTISDVISDSIDNLQMDSNFDAFQMVAFTSSYADQSGWSWGNQLLLPAFFWVPRSLWNSKPKGTSSLVTENLGFLNKNIGIPLWAEGYVNFGVLGLAVFLLIFGYLARLSDDCLVEIERTPRSAFRAIVSSFFAANTFILLRGDLATGTLYLQVMILFAFLLLLLIRRERRATDMRCIPPESSCIEACAAQTDRVLLP